MTILEKFKRLGMENAPGQEIAGDDIPALEGYHGEFGDFGHGDVLVHEVLPGAVECFLEGMKDGSDQAYTRYRGRADIREDVAEKLSAFVGIPLDPEKNVILTPGTQGALFLAMGANIMPGDKVALIQPDYFDYRKMLKR